MRSLRRLRHLVRRGPGQRGKFGSLGLAAALQLLSIAGTTNARAETGALPYLFPTTGAAATDRDSLADRIALPKAAGAKRVAVQPRSFGEWLRFLPMLPAASPVLLYDGSRKPNQGAHAAVSALDVPRRDLQQCADAVMRLRAEYLLALGRPHEIRFHPDPGKPRALTYSGTAEARADFMKYMLRVFSEAGSASLQAELSRVEGPVQPGDVLIQGGYPGHAILVLDVAEAAGRRYLLLGQSYMPAQQFHLLRNTWDEDLSPWYDEAKLDGLIGLKTPEWWRPFSRKDVRRFAAITGEPR